ncbi:MAG: hypothetical protein QOJ03_2718, partial [Frankiaceae bacterium]|nr:hypothetical protein [Frankiaceae bacterium]
MRSRRKGGLQPVASPLRLASLICLVVAASLGSTPTAAATGPTQVGWWTQANAGSVVAGAPAAAVPVGPDVPEGG